MATFSSDISKVDESTVSFLMKSVFDSLSLHIPDSNLIDQLFNLFLHLSAKNQELQSSLQVEFSKSAKFEYYLKLEVYLF